MSENYDNWERLVGAVMLKEKLRRIALRPSMDSISIISSASSSFRSAPFSFSRAFEFPAQAVLEPKYQETMAISESPRFYVDQRSGKNCYLVGARELQISSVEDSQSWKWTTQPDSSSERLLEVGELQAVLWLDIRCKIPSQILPQRKTYAAHLLFNLAKNCKGLESAKAVVRFINDEPEKDAEKRARVVHFEPSENLRDDGWMELELGSFYVGQGENGEVEARLFEKSWKFLKRGLIVGGIEFRPVFRYGVNPILSKQCLSRIVMA
ncbi:hypothetical protein F511_19794 [Dorcoceras hygrometricum]|uniref:Uncharacterized protein n=1 Tax=Dorcoceras hygrometricum TaxID=472368 RepID=A0A2Z7CH97_9LAMI|nr:hypothetical protein F511_19794 [Dorcoceras hygrometricum]